MDNWRNRLACRLANLALDHIATPRYSRLIGGAIRYGVMAAARDTALGEGPGAKMHDGQQMYHAYFLDNQMRVELAASGPKDWVTDRALACLKRRDPDSGTQVIVARVEEFTDVEDFMMRGQQS